MLNHFPPLLAWRLAPLFVDDGSMRPGPRNDALEAIKSDPSVRIILISFKAGSTGLNLVCCNHVILLDMWWNPALEDQAFDRAHRLGQRKEVRIWKLTIEDTVEDRMLLVSPERATAPERSLSE